MPVQNKNPNKLPRYEFVNDINVVKNNAQSIYTKIPIFNLPNISKKKVALVGLPDQISATKEALKNKFININIKFFIGPMVGINMDPESIDGIRIAYKIPFGTKIEKIKWREGKWPGFLSIKFRNYKKIKISKFYYNFLLPFYCSYESLFGVDFSNEDADISVGDAWSPKYDNKKDGGYSVIWSKNKRGENLLKQIEEKKIITLEKIEFDEAIRMHSHMLDFKKRGSQYRKKILNLFGIKTPNHKIKKVKFEFSRYFIEAVILFIIKILKTNISKIIIYFIPPSILGPLFNIIRLTWKKLTKKTKRKGLIDY